MKGRRHESCCKHGGGGALWLVLPLVLFVVLKTDILPQVAQFNGANFSNFADEMANKVSSLGSDSARWRPLDVSKSEGARDHSGPNQILATNGPKDNSLVNSDVSPPPPITTSTLTCNFSGHHSDTCETEGEVRIHGKSGMVYVVSSSTYRWENATITLRPYTRKWEKGTMSRIREVSIRSSPPFANDIVPPRCTVRHDVPAVVFSVGGCGSNFFHAMSDVIVPLFITAREYEGHVQLLATDYDAALFEKHRAVIAALSLYPVIDMDRDAAVRCFPAARVGMESHRILGIDPARSRHGYHMAAGFNGFLRSVFSLPRPLSLPVSRSSSSAAGRRNNKPRLVMVLRSHSRVLTNEAEAVAALTEVGFEVVVAGEGDVSDMARFAETVNSCDVMVGVHGAGLTNMVFLPRNATLVQVIPWGAMKWPCWYDFGEPATGMGLRYVEYEVTAEETTLKDKYPRDHPVFADPLSIHSKGQVWEYFLQGQNVTLDIPRFREAMHQVYLSITTE
ncbi:hypothetical protein QOZ80_5AG0390490 [Eleusine coracana subsp. coracana]|nr:hypothetical protein QOZ80_5AG0390490 [Eleusine coracana subsp. coracana]